VGLAHAFRLTPHEEVTAMPAADRIRTLIEPLFEDSAVYLYDVEHAGGILRVSIDRPGGVDLDIIAGLTRDISHLLDEHDPLPGRYTLEVSSPGLERPLRTPEHFRQAVGSDVTVKLVAGTEGDRRISGALTAADDETITVRVEVDDLDEPVERTLRLDDIERARTTFAWGPAPKPGSPKKRKKAATS
jgi:ribosome maturation factor RimP